MDKNDKSQYDDNYSNRQSYIKYYYKKNEQQDNNLSNNTQKKPKTKGFKIFVGISISILSIVVLIFSMLLINFTISALNIINYSKTINATSDTLSSSITSIQYSGADYETFDQKYKTDNIKNVLYFSDKEISAYINYDFLSTKENNALYKTLYNEYSFKLMKIDFYDTYKIENPDHFTNVTVVIKLNLSKFKENYFSSFPNSIIKMFLPEEVYLSADYEILRDTSKSDGNGYAFVCNSLIVNNLTKKESNKLLKYVYKLTKLCNSNDISSKIEEILSNYLLSKENKNSLFSKFEPLGIKHFSFFSNETEDYFIMYKNDINESKTITYHNTKDSENNNITSYTLLNNLITLSPLHKDGYEFLGWYNGEDISVATKVEELSAWDMIDYDLYAHWSLIEYKITYNLFDSTIDEDAPTKYTIESEVTLPIPVKNLFDIEFQGWTIKYTDSNILVPGYQNPDLSLKIKKGTFGDLTLSARFDDERILSLMVDGKHQQDVLIRVGETIDKSFIDSNFDTQAIGMAGYNVNVWYTNSAQTITFSDLLVSDDITLYGKWTYLVNKLSFYPYLDEFNISISTNSVIQIDSHKKFYAYFEYVIFYDKEESGLLKLNYTSQSNIENELETTINEIAENASLYKGLSWQYAINRQGILSLQIDTDAEEYAIKSADANKNHTSTQIDFEFKINYESSREDDFDDFKINNVTKTINVSNSYQLVYCLEQGYKPVCQQGSSAETMYNKAKAILREICDDSMSDFEKLRAMYEWLTYNVSYDKKALEITTSLTHCYDSWFIEGVLNNGVAVCEGYAKTLLLFARIEGIPAIYVIGNNHAWNKVMIDGVWYGIDATHADLTFNSKYEIMNYAEFLFSDEYKSSKGYSTNNYPEFTADTNYDIFKEFDYSYNNTDFDLYIEDVSELQIIVTYLKHQNHSNTTYTFEIEVDSSIDNYKIANALRKYNMSFISCYEMTGTGRNVYMIIA